eukprot:scaffold281556_cov21-Tisochrysis_lutea.AAC.1
MEIKRHVCRCAIGIMLDALSFIRTFQRATSKKLLASRSACRPLPLQALCVSSHQRCSSPHFQLERVEPQAVHSAGYIHRDIKPANITQSPHKDPFTCYVLLLTLPDPTKHAPPGHCVLLLTLGSRILLTPPATTEHASPGNWVLVDFGLARKYLDAQGAMLPPRPESKDNFRGSTTYASVHAHTGQVTDLLTLFGALGVDIQAKGLSIHLPGGCWFPANVLVGRRRAAWNVQHSLPGRCTAPALSSSIATSYLRYSVGCYSPESCRSSQIWCLAASGPVPGLGESPPVAESLLFKCCTFQAPAFFSFPCRSDSYTCAGPCIMRYRLIQNQDPLCGHTMFLSYMVAMHPSLLLFLSVWRRTWDAEMIS